MRYLVAVLALLPTLALADIAGSARVIDGDTIEVSGQRIRLHGIDAPEGRQTCRRDAATWLCGVEADRALRLFIDGRRVTCRERDVDRYGRIVAVCHAGGQDLNGRMVAEGMALAYRRYSTEYVDEEDTAQAAGTVRRCWSSATAPTSLGRICGRSCRPTARGSKRRGG